MDVITLFSHRWTKSGFICVLVMHGQSYMAYSISCSVTHTDRRVTSQRVKTRLLRMLMRNFDVTRQFFKQAKGCRMKVCTS